MWNPEASILRLKWHRAVVEEGAGRSSCLASGGIDSALPHGLVPWRAPPHPSHRVVNSQKTPGLGVEQGEEMVGPNRGFILRVLRGRELAFVALLRQLVQARLQTPVSAHHSPLSAGSAVHATVQGAIDASHVLERPEIAVYRHASAGKLTDREWEYTYAKACFSTFFDAF